MQDLRAHWADEEISYVELMGDLAKLWIDRLPPDAEFARRYWDAVEHLAASGGWGEEAVDAEPFQGPATRRIVGAYTRDDPDGTASALRLLADERRPASG